MFRLIVITSILLLFSCGTNCNTGTSTKAAPTYSTSNNGWNYTNITIEGCEYLYYPRELSHKGNCKQCAEVRKKEVNVALRLLLNDPRFKHLRK